MGKMSKAQILTRAREVVRREADAVAALGDQLGDSLVPVLARVLNCKGHILVTGTGTSHAMALRLAHLLACVGRPAVYVNAADGLHGGSGAITDKDVLFVISKGGRSAEINQLADIAKKRGATVIAQTEQPDSPLGRMADAVYHVQAVGDVDPYGMVATGSSLVNGAADDVLCVLLLEMTGYSKAEFGSTHPGGAVGRRIAEEGKR